MNAPVLEKSQAGPPKDDGTATECVAAGLQKTSLIDYPGKVSCVVFLTGCNFTCPFCHNPDLALGRRPQRIPQPQLLAFLAERRHFLDGVVITGGEPTLHPGLAHLCREVQSLGLTVKLDTNGSRPEVLDSLIGQGLINDIAMDIKTAPERYGPPLCPGQPGQAVTQSIRLIMQSGCGYEFRTTCLQPFVTEEILPQICGAISGAKRYVLQRFRPENVLSPEYFRDVETDGSEAQMIRLQKIAAPWVETCLVR